MLISSLILNLTEPCDKLIDKHLEKVEYLLRIGYTPDLDEHTVFARRPKSLIYFYQKLDKGKIDKGKIVFKTREETKYMDLTCNEILWKSFSNIKWKQGI